MSEAHPPIDDDDAALAELAAKDLAAVRHVHAQLVAATDTDEINSLGRTYQRVARSLRQSLALKAKFRADREKAAVAAQRPAPDLDAESAEERADGRIVQLQEFVGRVIAAAHRRDAGRQTELLDRLDAYLDDESEAWDFGLQPLEAHVRTVCAALDLPAEIAARWRDLPQTPWTVMHDDDPAWDLAAAPPRHAHDTG